MSFLGPITRSRSRATTNPKSDSVVGESIVLTMEQSEIANKLSELLEVIKKSVQTNEQNKETLLEAHQLGIQNRTELLKLHEHQQAQMATIMTQNSIQTGPALHPTPFYGKPTDDLPAFLSHFERYSDFCGWDDKKRLRALPLYLHGNASSWYASTDTKKFETYENLVEALRGQFSSPASIWLWRQQLSARKQGETEPLTNYASDIRRLYKRLGLSDTEGMHYFIQGLRADLKGHVILGQPKTLAEAEHLANLKEAVATNTPNLAQQKLEAHLQSVIKNLETLTTTQQTNVQNVAAYNMSARSNFSHNTDNERHHYDRDHVAKLVQEEVRRQTRFMAPASVNRPSNSGLPSSRNRRTTDGLPICNKCDKVGHIARNCRAGDLQHQFPQGPQYNNAHIRPDLQHQFPQAPQYNSHIRPEMQHQPPRVPQHNSYVRPGKQHQVHQYNSHIRHNAPTFVPQQGYTSNNPFQPESGN